MLKLTADYLGEPLTVEFTVLAVENIEEIDLDWTNDYHDLRTGQVTAPALLAQCQDGVDRDREIGWLEYVECLKCAINAA